MKKIKFITQMKCGRHVKVMESITFQQYQAETVIAQERHIFFHTKTLYFGFGLCCLRAP
jgi:hypothetical protein